MQEDETTKLKPNSSKRRNILTQKNIKSKTEETSQSRAHKPRGPLQIQLKRKTKHKAPSRALASKNIGFFINRPILV